MMKSAIGIIVGLGIIVALLSIYKASVSGFMSQVGLVDSDFSAAIMQDKMKEIANKTKAGIACDLPTRLSGTMRFLLSGDDKQGELAFRLGESRISCGARILADGDPEAGTYEVLKGLGYMKQGYQFISERAEADSRVCSYLPPQEYREILGGVLEATSGRVYDLIWGEWQEMESMKAPVEQMCLDHRQSTR